MLPKIIIVAAAFASIVNGAAVHIEARQQGELAFCTISTTPYSLPNPESALQEEFIIMFNNEFFNSIPPDTAIVTGSTSFTGSGAGPYTVTKSLGAVTLTAEETRQTMRSWAGRTFAGVGQVAVASWFIDSVVC